ncbi:hypothetical protein M430DRAFT_54198 [Amorphotheca resinae ATCC 22711]|uniref:Uncharacterized protein n=1 Tax=Amorphotheca resinae ATCC 22711 TaxID=857342 RepID=A0A2T3API1_AMORE|nr:hypothetical protein M430DRAFT_54198 [Amorphotheca resinae ATCC 22711]PSS06902.1 hypothetical protein M430DRAFT_54198 [Amorphotheca resinae ATCC 22711]
MASPSIPPLMPLERAGPKGYVRYLFPFPLAENYNLDEVARVLKDSLAATQKRLPVLACEAVPDTEAKQAGVLRLQESEVGDIKVVDMRAPEAFPMTYQQLREKRFPLEAFEADVFCRRPVWPSPGDRLPITAVQANFIQGGLILNWCIFHMIGDGKTFQKMLEIWAEECRRAQGLEITSPVHLPDELFDRSRVMQGSGRNKGRIEDHPEYVLLPFTPTGAPPKMLSPTHRARVFYFSPATLAQLKKDASPANAKMPASDVPWISTNDALSALLWRAVMAAQFPLDELEGNPTSVFNIAVDGRRRADPPLPEDTMGCFLEYVAPSMGIRTMLTEASLADIAVEIRRNVAKANQNYTDDIVTLLDSIPDHNRLVPTAFLDVPGHNCVLTSWVNFDLYTIDWGHMFGGAVEAVRAPNVGIINGCQVVLPAVPESRGGGFELLVGVEESAIHRLEMDALWTKYATMV